MDIALTNDNVRKMIEGEVKSVDFEKRYVRKKRRNILGHRPRQTVLRDPNGRPIHFISQIRGHLRE